MKLNGAMSRRSWPRSGCAGWRLIGPVEAGADMTLRGDQWTASALRPLQGSKQAAISPTAGRKPGGSRPPFCGRPGGEALGAAAAIAREPSPAEITGDSHSTGCRSQTFSLWFWPPQRQSGARWSDANFLAPLTLPRSG